MSEKKNIGLLIIATGKYDQFIPPLFHSIKRFFCTEDDVKLFAFTDSNDIIENDNIIRLQQEHLGWPGATLMRYHIFDKHKEELSKMDYLFYCDVDMKFVAPVGREILPEDNSNGLVGTIHPGFYDQRTGRGTYETRKESTAFVKEDEGENYFAGGFNGGTSEAFLKMAAHIKMNVDIDKEKGIIAVWHDESHLNRYFINNPPKQLSPSYCYPESWAVPFEKKLVALVKNHAEFQK